MDTTQYGVTGMTCGHCVAAVKDEVAEVAGVTGVEVVLVEGGTSTVTVTGEHDASAVRAAVDEAGYEIA